jgi:hypothetical protein
LVADGADFFAVVFLGATFAFAAGFEAPDPGFLPLLDDVFDGMKPPFDKPSEMKFVTKIESLLIVVSPFLNFNRFPIGHSTMFKEGSSSIFLKSP